MPYTTRLLHAKELFKTLITVVFHVGDGGECATQGIRASIFRGALHNIMHEHLLEALFWTVLFGI